MLWGGQLGELEVRRRGGRTALRGRFPYNKTATLSDGGRRGKPKKERFAPNAFEFRVNDPAKEIHLLAGHSFDRPLASKLTDSLVLKDTAEALTFEATIVEAILGTSYGQDVLAQIAAGLAFGISPGFRIPPERAVPAEEAETFEEEEDDGTIDENGDPRRGAIIRTVHQALLYEISVVTRPAFKQTEIEAEQRNWPGTVDEPPDAGLQRTLNRWRA